jgi:hypothetical protein
MLLSWSFRSGTPYQFSAIVEIRSRSLTNNYIFSGFEGSVQVRPLSSATYELWINVSYLSGTISHDVRHPGNLQEKWLPARKLAQTHVEVNTANCRWPLLPREPIENKIREILLASDYSNIDSIELKQGISIKFHKKIPIGFSIPALITVSDWSIRFEIKLCLGVRGEAIEWCESFASAEPILPIPDTNVPDFIERPFWEGLINEVYPDLKRDFTGVVQNIASQLLSQLQMLTNDWWQREAFPVNMHIVSMGLTNRGLSAMVCPNRIPPISKIPTHF